MIGLNRMIEERQGEIARCKGAIYNLERQQIKSRYDMDTLEVLRSTVATLEDEIERMKRY